MYAFAGPPVVTFSHKRVPQLSSRRLSLRLSPRTPSRPLWFANADGNGGVSDDVELDPAIMSSQGLRSELEELARQRKAQAEDTERRLKEMNDQLSNLITQLRAEAGMPPVANFSESPKISDDVPAVPSISPPVSSPSSTSNDTDDSSSSSDEPYMDPKNFGYESSPGWQVLAESLKLPENEDKVEFRIQCDTHGCSIVEVKGDVPAAAGVRSQFIHSGPGFRVGFDPAAPKTCCALVGSDSWTIALSYDEMRHFKRLLLSLQKRMDRIGAGKEEEPAKDAAVLRRSADGLFNMRTSRAGLDCSVEHESKLLWAQAIGQPKMGQYCIRAIFFEGRKSEIYWAPDCISSLLVALNKLRIE